MAKSHLNETVPPRMAYSPKEAAQLLSVCKRTVDTLIADGTLQSFKIRKSRRVTLEAIRQLMPTADAE